MGKSSAKLFFGIAFCFSIINLQAFGHPPDDQTDIISFRLGGNRDNPFGESYGGYGFLGTSEAEAQSRFQFRCSEQDQINYIESYCRQPVSGLGITPTEFLTSHLQNLVLTRLKEQAFEYYSYQLSTVNGLGTDAPRLERPACIPENSQTWTSLTSTGVLASNPNPNHVQTAKQQSVERINEFGNMAKAWFYSRRLQHKMENSYGCSSANPNLQNCVPMERTNFRLQTSFPSLWMYSRQGNYRENLNRGGRERAYPGTRNFASNIARLIGAYEARGDDSITDLEAAKALGDEEIRNATEGGEVDYDSFERKLERAITAANEAPQNTLLRSALNMLSASHAQLQGQHRNQMQAEMNCLCSGPACQANDDVWNSRHQNTDPINQIRILASQRPNIVRQALMDMNESERYLAQAVLCQTRVMDHLRMEPQCHGVTGGPLPENGPVNVARRKVNDWPYGSQNYYTIDRASTPANSPTTVKLQVYMQVNPQIEGEDVLPAGEPNGIPDAVEAQARRWKNDINGYLNCATGMEETYSPLPKGSTKTCPFPADADQNPNYGWQRTPPVKFEIEMIPTTNPTSTQKPLITIHECFNASIPGSTADRSNCDNVRQHYIDRCLTRNSDDDESDCAKKYNKVKNGGRSYRLDRANSSNYTMRSHDGTIRHEVMHLLGVPDEYDSTRKPFSMLGEHDSMMNCSKCKDAKVYPRHLDQILEPLECARRE